MPITGLSFAEKSVKADALVGDDSSPEQPFSIQTTVCDAFTLPHESQLSAMPSLDEYRATSSSPLILTADPRCTTQTVNGIRNHCARLPFNVAVPMETDVFAGHLVVQVKGLPGTPESAFRGTRWMGKTVFQGQFKRPLPAQDLWVGQELWSEPLLPESLRRLVFTTAAKFFSSTCKIKTQGEGVGFMNPLLAMSQVVNVSRPGQQPDPTGPVEEDMTLCCSSLVDKKGAPLSGAVRQKHFDKLSTLATCEFDPENIYTFVILQSFLDLQQYKLSLGGLLTMDLTQILNGQPLQMMCKNIREDKTLLSVLLWHKRLNFPHERPAVMLRESETSDTSSTCGSQSTMDRSSSSGMSSSNVSSLLECNNSCELSSTGSSSADCCGSGRDQDVCCSSRSSSADDGDDCCSEYASACSRLSDTEDSNSSDRSSEELEQDLSGCTQQQQQSVQEQPCSNAGAAVPHQQKKHKKASKTSKAAKYLKKKTSKLLLKLQG